MIYGEREYAMAPAREMRSKVMEFYDMILQDRPIVLSESMGETEQMDKIVFGQLTDVQCLVTELCHVLAFLSTSYQSKKLVASDADLPILH